MAIYKAIKKDLGTGSITGVSQQSYVVPYYVFTDNNTTPYAIYEQARSETGIVIYDVNNHATNEKLPVYGTIDSSTYVSNVSIERASENNLVAVPQYGLAVKSNNTSWTCWNYVVTFSGSDTTTVSTGEAPWNSDTATSCSFSPKTYERYDNKTLIPNYTASKKNDPTALLASDDGNLDDTPVPNYPLNQAKFSNLQNTVGDDLYRNRTVYNYLLNFSYAVRRFDAKWMYLYMNSMNLEDCVICGLPIKKYGAVINEMRVEQAEWNGKTYYNVNVEVEIQYQQRLVYDELVSSGHRAYMIEGSETAITNELNRLKSGLTKEKSGFVFKITDASTAKKYPVPIEELTDIRQRDKVPDKRWFMKKKNLGYFDNLVQKTKDTKTEPITKTIYIDEGTVGESNIKIKYKSNSQSTTTLYLMTIEQGAVDEPVQTDDGLVYSVVSGPYSSQKKENFRYISTGTMTINGTTTTVYRQTRYVERPILTVADRQDMLLGQYNSIQSPLALNKFGGVYFSGDETSKIDNVTEPGKIDMYDPMLGKVKDYQHIARDWTALAFPKKGMFWGTTADNNFDAMKKVSKYFK